MLKYRNDINYERDCIESQQGQERFHSSYMIHQTRREKEERLDRLQNEISTPMSLMEKVIEQNADRGIQADSAPTASSLSSAGV